MHRLTPYIGHNDTLTADPCIIAGDSVSLKGKLGEVGRGVSLSRRRRKPKQLDADAVDTMVCAALDKLNVGGYGTDLSDDEPVTKLRTAEQYVVALKTGGVGRTVLIGVFTTVVLGAVTTFFKKQDVLYALGTLYRDPVSAWKRSFCL